MKNLSLAKKTFIGYGVAIIILIAFSIMAINAQRTIADKYNKVYDTYTVKCIDIGNFTKNYKELESLLSDYSYAADDGIDLTALSEQIAEVSDTCSKQLDELISSVPTADKNGQAQKSLENVQQTLENGTTAFKQIVTLVSQKKYAQAMNIYQKSIKAVSDDVDEEVSNVSKYFNDKSEWDGPFSLKDMLEIPEKIEPLVSDYRMNLVQVRSSGELCFSDPDVNMVFDMSRLIYARDYAKIKEVYSDHDIPADLGVVIGAITESQKLINHALELEQRGGQINMCNALEELRQEGIEEGRLEGRQEGRREGRWEGILEGIRATVRTCRNFNISEVDTVRNIMNEFSLSQEEAVNYVKKYW